MKIKIKSFTINIASLIPILFCTVWFIQAAYMSPKAFNINIVIRSLFSILLVANLMLYKDLSRLKRYVPVPVVIYAVSIIASSIMNKLPLSSIFISIGVAFGYLAAFSMFGIRKGVHIENVMDGLYFIIQFFTLLNILNIVIWPEGLWKNATGRAAIYFNGGKFSVFYLYILFMVTVFIRDIKRYGKIYIEKGIALYCIGSFVMLRSKCISGVLGITIFSGVIFFYIFHKSTTSKSRKRTWLIPVLLIAFALIIYLVLFARIQENFSWFRYLMYDVLNKELSIDGRYRVYSGILKLMRGHWKWGYGYGNSVIYNSFRIQNAQNGFLEVLLNYGIFGFIIFIWIIIYLFRIFLKNAETRWERGIILSVLTVYLFFGVFEVPFNLYFFITCGMLYHSKWFINHSVQ